MKIEERIERIGRTADSVVSDVDSAIGRLKSRILALKTVLADEERKTALEYSQVKAIEPRFRGNPDTIFIGARKYRIKSENGHLTVEKSKSDVSVWIKSPHDFASFHLDREQARELARWILGQ